MLSGLFHALHDPDEEVRLRVALALQYDRPIAETTLDNQALTALLSALDDSSADVRKVIHGVLYQCQVSGTVRIAALLEPGSAAAVELGPRATCELMALVPELVPTLLGVLRDHRPEIRACAAGVVASANKYLGWIKGRREIHRGAGNLAPTSSRLLGWLPFGHWPRCGNHRGRTWMTSFSGRSTTMIQPSAGKRLSCSVWRRSQVWCRGTRILRSRQRNHRQRNW